MVHKSNQTRYCQYLNVCDIAVQAVRLNVKSFYTFLSSLTHSPSLLSSLCAVPVSICSLCQAHHVCVRTLPLRWWASYMCRPHGVATSTRCFLYHLRKQGEQRTMRCHFLNPSFVLFYTFFCPTGALFVPPPPAALPEAVLISHKMFFLIAIQVPVSLGFFFFFFKSSLVFTVEQWWRGTWDNDDHPLLSLNVWLTLYLPVKWLVLTRTDHQNESSPRPTHP